MHYKNVRIQHNQLFDDLISADRRVHWLCARAQNLRWEEEVILVGYEMTWTVRYFTYNKELWEGRRNVTGPGPASYATRKAAMWNTLAINADRTFAQVNKSYVSQFN